MGGYNLLYKSLLIQLIDGEVLSWQAFRPPIPTSRVNLALRNGLGKIHAPRDGIFFSPPVEFICMLHLFMFL